MDPERAFGKLERSLGARQKWKERKRESNKRGEKEIKKKVNEESGVRKRIRGKKENVTSR